MNLDELIENTMILDISKSKMALHFFLQFLLIFRFSFIRIGIVSLLLIEYVYVMIVILDLC